MPVKEQTGTSPIAGKETVIFSLQACMDSPATWIVSANLHKDPQPVVAGLSDPVYIWYLLVA